MGRRSSRLGQKNREQIARLVADHHAAVYGYAYRLCGSEADAEDCVQEAFLLAHQKLDQLRDQSKARPWLLAIVRNCFLKDLRKRRPAVESNIDFDLGDVAEELVELPFDIERLQDALDRLPEEFRVVVLMHYFEFLSYREIAEELDAPIGTVMSRLARAKMRLRAAMTRSEVGGRRPEVSVSGSTRCLTPDP